MILHCTTKLAAKLPAATFTASVLPGDEQGESPLGDWHAHLLILDHRNCVLFCHDLTRYTLFLPGLRAPQFAELGRCHRELFLAALEAQGVAYGRLAHVELAIGPLVADSRTDRSVLGSLRVAAEDLQHGMLPRVPNVLDLEPVATSRRLNERPCTVHKTLIWPEQAMRALVEQLGSEKIAGMTVGLRPGHA